MDEYLYITVLSRPQESEAEFKTRLSTFWTHMLRHRESDFEKVYAETIAFEKVQDRLSRKYLVEAEVAPVLEAEMQAAHLEYQPIDPDDLYSKYEAVPPEWMWIEH